jgi:hypothetical protein
MDTSNHACQAEREPIPNLSPQLDEAYSVADELTPLTMLSVWNKA